MFHKSAKAQIRRQISPEGAAEQSIRRWLDQILASQLVMRRVPTAAISLPTKANPNIVK
ncbi:hypothetical protein HYR54_08180 [Candidatus Acetothermia bacterium]|nr:hypothetical protein [Candidatus Acetothermia bacterium]